MPLLSFWLVKSNESLLTTVTFFLVQLVAFGYPDDYNFGVKPQLTTHKTILKGSDFS